MADQVFKNYLKRTNHENFCLRNSNTFHTVTNVPSSSAGMSWNASGISSINGL